jgi:hypothetical protein
MSTVEGVEGCTKLKLITSPDIDDLTAQRLVHIRNIKIGVTCALFHKKCLKMPNG